MKFIIFLVLALSSVIAFDLRSLQPSETTAPQVSSSKQNVGAHQFPYQVCISFQNSFYETSLCSGSLIGNEWILTAAHCGMNAISATVYLGTASDRTSQVVHIVTEDDIIIHSNWDDSTGDNDIALIKIPRTSYSDDIQPVKLPSASSFYSQYYGDSVIAVGWHHASNTFSSSKSKLKWTSLQVLPIKMCAKSNAELMSYRAICAVAQEKVLACSNDSGGALVLEFSEVLIGINALRAPADCPETYSAVFTRIPDYLSWITSHTGISY